MLERALRMSLGELLLGWSGLVRVSVPALLLVGTAPTVTVRRGFVQFSRIDLIFKQAFALSTAARQGVVEVALCHVRAETGGLCR